MSPFSSKRQQLIEPYGTTTPSHLETETAQGLPQAEEAGSQVVQEVERVSFFGSPAGHQNRGRVNRHPATIDRFGLFLRLAV
jgi:hypothetical protein